jgi:antitoxin HigA-1
MSIARYTNADYGEIADPAARRVGPIHPGAILKEEFLEPMAISAYTLAKVIGVPRNRVTAILHGDRAISADTALRLGRYFGTSAEFWLGLQTAYDLETARREIGERDERGELPRLRRRAVAHHATSGATSALLHGCNTMVCFMPGGHVPQP